jgi:hypothetical protein
MTQCIVKEMSVLYCCRIYSVIAAGVLSAGLLAPEGASAALTQRAVQQRSLLSTKTPDDGNEGDEGDEGDEVWPALLPSIHFTPCTFLTLLFDTLLFVLAQSIPCSPSNYHKEEG